MESFKRVSRARGELGQSIASFGRNLAQEAIERKANREFAEFKGYVNEQMSEMRNFVETNPDDTLYQAQWNEGHVRNIEARMEGMSRLGRDAAGNWWKANGPAFGEEVNTLERERINERDMIDALSMVEDMATKDWTVEASAESARRRAINPDAPIVTEEEYILQETDKRLRPLVGRGLTPLGYKSLMDRTKANIEAARTARLEMQIKEEMAAVFDAGSNKDDAYDVLDEYYKNKKIDINQRGVLGNWLDNFVSGRNREANKANSAAYDTIAQMAIDEKSPEEVEAAINGMNITPQAKIDLKNSWLAATKTWNDTGINPYTQTQDYAKLVKLVHRIEDPEDGINLGDIDAEVNSGKDGAPVISFNDRQMLKNMLEERNKPAATGYSRTHPLAELYISQLNELYDYDPDTVGKWKTEKTRKYVKDRFAIEEALKENWGNEPAIEKAVAPILDTLKKDEVQSFFSRVMWGKRPPKWVPGWLGGMESVELPTVTTQAEVDELESGTEFKTPDGKRYRKE